MRIAVVLLRCLAELIGWLFITLIVLTIIAILSAYSQAVFILLGLALIVIAINLARTGSPFTRKTKREVP